MLDCTDSVVNDLFDDSVRLSSYNYETFIASEMKSTSKMDEALTGFHIPVTSQLYKYKEKKLLNKKQPTLLFLFDVIIVKKQTNNNNIIIIIFEMRMTIDRQVHNIHWYVWRI